MNGKLKRKNDSDIYEDGDHLGLLVSNWPEARQLVENQAFAQQPVFLCYFVFFVELVVILCFS